MFSVGQQVVCVDNQNGYSRRTVECPLTVGETYTIVDIRKWRSIKVDGDPQHYWSPLRFRPKTDISVFTTMLKTEKERV